MLSGKLWPAHPHPYKGESLSSWVVRTAHANGLKVQTFCDHAFGKDFQVWCRDIDRNAPNWFLHIMSHRTGTSIKRVQSATFKLYEKRLFPAMYSASHLRWVMPIKHLHRLNKRHAIQYCPRCLAVDNIPYFRLSWRLALYTFCSKHRIMMADQCHQCGAPVAFHRVELGKPKQVEADSLDCCWKCHGKLSEATTEAIHLHPKLVNNRWSSLLKAIDRQFYPAGALSYSNLALVHQICRLLLSKKQGERLRRHICKNGQYPLLESMGKYHIFEQKRVEDRHKILQQAWWLTTNRRKLRVAINEKAIRINFLYRDSEPRLKGYVTSLIRTPDSVNKPV